MLIDKDENRSVHVNVTPGIAATPIRDGASGLSGPLCRPSTRAAGSTRNAVRASAAGSTHADSGPSCASSRPIRDGRWRPRWRRNECGRRVDVALQKDRHAIEQHIAHGAAAHRGDNPEQHRDLRVVAESSAFCAPLTANSDRPMESKRTTGCGRRTTRDVAAIVSNAATNATVI